MRRVPISPRRSQCARLIHPSPAAAGPAAPVTIAFTDIEGSTRMVEELGDRGWLDLLRVHDRVVRHHLRACGGCEVKHQGDGFMLAFPSVPAGLRFALALQGACAERAEQHPRSAMRIRIGLHHGPALRHTGDFIGRTVVVAARIAQAARGGEILVSAEAREHARDHIGMRFGAARTLALRGLRDPQTVHAVRPDHLDAPHPRTTEEVAR